MIGGMDDPTLDSYWDLSQCLRMIAYDQPNLIIGRVVDFSVSCASEITERLLDPSNILNIEVQD